MNVFEYLLESNKDRLLDSKLTMVLYKNKPLITYLNKDIKVFNIERKYKLKDVLFFMNKTDIPNFDYEDFINNFGIYKKYPHLCLSEHNELILIENILKLIDGYKNKLSLPIGISGIKWASNMRKVKYINKFTKEIYYETMDFCCNDSIEANKLKKIDILKWSQNTNWSEYESLNKELAQ